MLTIGHSNRPLDEFIGLLQPHGVTRVVDVRSVPRSSHNPQFNKDALPGSGWEAEITEQVPDQRIAWESIGKTITVSFTPP